MQTQPRESHQLIRHSRADVNARVNSFPSSPLREGLFKLFFFLPLPLVEGRGEGLRANPPSTSKRSRQPEVPVAKVKGRKYKNYGYFKRCRFLQALSPGLSPAGEGEMLSNLIKDTFGFIQNPLVPES